MGLAPLQARLDVLAARLDALKRRCSTGYSCGSACISPAKECRSEGGKASTGKERLRRLQQLAQGLQPAAASGSSGARQQRPKPSRSSRPATSRPSSCAPRVPSLSSRPETMPHLLSPRAARPSNLHRPRRKTTAHVQHRQQAVAHPIPSSPLRLLPPNSAAACSAVCEWLRTAWWSSAE